jgi:hypothetical protein
LNKLAKHYLIRRANSAFRRRIVIGAAREPRDAIAVTVADAMLQPVQGKAKNVRTAFTRR